jgi:hypothetical protein
MRGVGDLTRRLTCIRLAHLNVGSSFYWALVAFVIIFPKSGVKAGVIPLTTGYAAICVAALLALTDNLLHSRKSFASLATLGLSMPFGSVVALSLTINGSVDQGSALAAVMSFILIPAIFLGPLSCQFVMIPARRLAGAKMRHQAGVLHGVGAQLPRPRLGQMIRTYFGRPSSNMRLGA